MRDKSGILPELIIPICSVAFGIYYVSTVISLPYEAKMDGIAVTGGIMVLTVILFARFWMEIKRGEKELSFNGYFSSPGFEAKRYSVVGLTILFILGMPFVGFSVALFFFVLLMILVLGGMRRLRLALYTASILTIVGFAVFIVAIDVPFPQSIVDRTILSYVGKI